MSNTTQTIIAGQHYIEQLMMDGSNYLDWRSQAKSLLTMNGLNQTIEENYPPTEPEIPDNDPDRVTKVIDRDARLISQEADMAKARYLIANHLVSDLRTQFHTIETPKELWAHIIERFDNLAECSKMEVRHEWNHLRFLDSPNIMEYNIKLQNLVQKMKYVGLTEEVTQTALINKTLSTFPLSHWGLVSMLREIKFKTYQELYTKLLKKEKEYQQLLTNEKLRPPKSSIPSFGTPQGIVPAAIPVANYIQKGNNRSKDRLGPYQNKGKKFAKQTKQAKFNKPDNMAKKPNNVYKINVICSECGCKGHTTDTCRTQPHLRLAYKMYKEKGNLVENNSTKVIQNYNSDSMDCNLELPMNIECNMTKLSVSDSNDALIDSGSSHTIINNKSMFSYLRETKPISVITVHATPKIIGNHIGNVILQLPKGSLIKIQNAIYSPNAPQNIIALHDLRKNGYGLQIPEGLSNQMYLLKENKIVEIFENKSNSLPITQIQAIPIVNTIVHNNKYQLWHERLGHPSKNLLRIMITKNLVTDLPITLSDLNKFSNLICPACAQGKLIKQPYSVKPLTKLPTFLERIHVDVCGPIDPPSGPNRYFMVVVDSAEKLLYVYLLPSKNLVFARLVRFIIEMRNKFPEHSIKKIRVDNAAEFTSKPWMEFLYSCGIEQEISTDYEHVQNGLAESHIKRVQMVARPLLLRSSLPLTAWALAVKYANALLNIRPMSNTYESAYQRTMGYLPSVNHIRTFGCAVYVPIPPPAKNSKLGPQRQLGIYVGCKSASIIYYIDPYTGDVFQACFKDCIFDESIFPIMENDESKSLDRNKFSFDYQSHGAFQYKDEPNPSRNIEITRILHLYDMATKLPLAFEDINKSAFQETNTEWITKIDHNIPTNKMTKPRQKRGNPHRSNELSKKKLKTHNTTVQNTVPIIESNNTIIHNDIIPNSFKTAMLSPQASKWKEAIIAELVSLKDRNVFSKPCDIPKNQKRVGCRWVFALKYNANGDIARYKARLVAQGFTQRPGIDFMQTYTPVMDLESYRYLITLSVSHVLKMHLIDIVTAYLYGNISEEIYTKIPEGYNLINTVPKNLNEPCVRIMRSLYGLKQSGRNWYRRLREFLLKLKFKTNDMCPYIFVKVQNKEIAIIACYVDDLNIIGTPLAVYNVKLTLAKEFEQKDLGETSYCLNIQLKHIQNGIFVYQETYARKLLDRFRMSDCNPVRIPLNVRRLKIEHDEYGPLREGEEIIGTQVPYQEAIGALLYLANSTRPDISFAVSLLSRHSKKPTMRHWKGVKQILRYLKRTIDMGIYYYLSENQLAKARKLAQSRVITNKNMIEKFKIDLTEMWDLAPIIGYADAGYQSDPADHGKSQTGYCFLRCNAIFSWRSQKQGPVATSACHSEIIALHEATRQAQAINLLETSIAEMAGVKLNKKLITLFEDNSAAIKQTQSGYIKSDRVKHIPPSLIGFIADKQDELINVQKVQSAENIADIFTKTLGANQHWKLLKMMGLRRLSTLQS